MGKNAHTKCKDIIQIAITNGFVNEISLKELITIIKTNIGANPRTIRDYMIYLRDLNFIEKINHYTYKIKLMDKEDKIKQLEKELKILKNGK